MYDLLHVLFLYVYHRRNDLYEHLLHFLSLSYCIWLRSVILLTFTRFEYKSLPVCGPSKPVNSSSLACLSPCLSSITKKLLTSSGLKMSPTRVSTCFISSISIRPVYDLSKQEKAEVIKSVLSGLSTTSDIISMYSSNAILPVFSTSYLSTKSFTSLSLIRAPIARIAKPTS